MAWEGWVCLVWAGGPHSSRCSPGKSSSCCAYSSSLLFILFLRVPSLNISNVFYCCTFLRVLYWNEQDLHTVRLFILDLNLQHLTYRYTFLSLFSWYNTPTKIRKKKLCPTFSKLFCFPIFTVQLFFFPSGSRSMDFCQEKLANSLEPGSPGTWLIRRRPIIACLNGFAVFCECCRSGSGRNRIILP